MVKDTDFLPKTEKKESSVKIEAGQFFDEETFQGIMKLEEESFPPGTAYDNEEEYYRTALQNKEYINVVAREVGGRVIGYMLLTPQSEQVAETIEDDPEMVEDPECAYVETMEIDSQLQKSLRGGKIFVEMVNRGVEELLQKGYKRLCTHARKSMGLNEAIKRYFKGQIIKTRDIPKWKWVNDEPYEYVEGNLKKEGEN